MKKYTFIIIGLFNIFFLGCSTKTVTIKTTIPAQINTLTKKRNIAVVPFKGDKINFTGRLEAKLASIRINNKPYFHIIDRDRIGYILKELKFQSSDLVGNKVAKFGKLAGAQVIITGNVKTSAINGSYRKPEQICSYYKNGKCLYYKTIYITCRTSEAILNTSINAIDVNTAQIIDAVNISKNYHGDSCKNRELSLLENFFKIKKFKTAQEALNDLADEAVNEYIKRIAPHYMTIQVELMDKVKSIDLTDLQEKKFENALIYIQHNRLNMAEYLLKQLNEETAEKSYEIAYDLGVVEEALGKLDEAKAAYNLADKIILDSGAEPNELVDRAIERVNNLLKKRKELEKQGVK